MSVFGVHTKMMMTAFSNFHTLGPISKSPQHPSPPTHPKINLPSCGCNTYPAKYLYGFSEIQLCVDGPLFSHISHIVFASSYTPSRFLLGTLGVPLVANVRRNFTNISNDNSLKEVTLLSHTFDKINPDMDLAPQYSNYCTSAPQ